MCCMLTGSREKVTRCMDVVFDGAGLDGSARDGFSLDEGDGVASKEVVLCHWLWEVNTLVVSLQAEVMAR